MKTEPGRIKFYRSRLWRKVSKLYMGKQNYICERCGDVAAICHHRRYISEADIGDLEKTLGEANLECLCLACHNAEHGGEHQQAIFDDVGRMIGIKESAGLREFEWLRGLMQ